MKKGIGLALGGGAARGISHIGVIQVIEEHGIELKAVAGTSMGALVGAVYLMEGNAQGLLRRMYDFFEDEAFKDAEFEELRERREEEEPGWLQSMGGLIKRGYRYSLSVTRQSIIGRDVFSRIIENLIPDIKIEDLPKPFAAVCLDVTRGKELVWTKGSLRDAVWSSSAIPGFFPPLEKNGRILVDGGWTNAVPIDPVRSLSAARVIAVDISREVEEMIEYRRGISLMLRAALLTSKHLREMQLKKADLVLRPEVGYIHWADFSNPQQVVQKGREAALAALPEMKRLQARGFPGAVRTIIQAMTGSPPQPVVVERGDKVAECHEPAALDTTTPSE